MSSGARFRVLAWCGANLHAPMPATSLGRRSLAARALQSYLEANSASSPGTENVEWVTSPDDPRLAIYRKKTQRDHREYQLQVRALSERVLQETQGDPFLLPGKHALKKLDCPVRVHYSWDCLRRLLDAKEAGHSVAIDSILVAADTQEPRVRLATSACDRVYMADAALIQAEFSSEGTTQKGSVNFVVAHPFPRPVASIRPPVLVLDDLGAPQNVGQILRTAFHLGITSVLASRAAWNNLGGRACRVSMGWLYFMDFHLAEPLSEGLQALKARGICIYAAEDHFSEAVAPHQPLGDRNWALIVGHEDDGVSEVAVTLSDRRVCVPQRQGESLNVAHAAAICLYELSRCMASEQKQF